MTTPKAVRSGEFDLLGVCMRVHVLDTGERVIEEDSVMAFFEALGEVDLDQDEVEAFARWMRAL